MMMPLSQTKKVALIIFILSTNLFAGGSHIQILAGSSKVENLGSTFVFGTGIDLVETLHSGFEFGIGGDALYSNNKDYNTNLGVDFSLLLGYNFKNRSNIPLAIRTGIGYGLGTVRSEFTQSGIVYQVGMEYDFSKKFGIGLKYKIQDFEISLANSTEQANTKNSLLYFYFKK